MNNSEILQKIIQVLDNNKGQDGWTDLAVVGKPLIDNGVNYKALGYMKLRELLEEYVESIEIKRDETTHKVPVLYAKKRGSTLSKQDNPKTKVTINKQTVQTPNNLMQWAYMGDFRQAVNDLKNMALKERWFYKAQNPAFPFPILSKYLTYTFFRLSKEPGKIIMTD